MKTQVYTIQVMDDKDYFNLDEQFPNLTKKDLKDSFGFADKEAGEAYVRRSGVGEGVDTEAVQHEIQELMSETSEHEKNGLRFGWFKKIFGFSSQPAVRVIAPILASILAGPLGGLAAGLAGGGASALAQKTTTGEINPLQVALSGAGGALAGGGMAAGVQGAKAGGAGFLGQVKGGLVGTAATAGKASTSGLIGTRGAILGLGTTPAAASGLLSPALQGPVTASQSAMGYSNLSQVPSNILGSAAANTAVKTMGAMQGPVTAAQSAQGMTQLPNVLGGVGGGAQAAVPAAVPKTLMENIGGFATQPTNLLGAGSLAASMAPKTPQFEMPPIVSDLRGKLMSGEALSPLGQQARTSLSEMMAAKPTELYAPAKDEYYQATLRRTRSAYEDAQKNLDKAYNAAGVYGSGEHLAAKDKLAQQLTNAETDLYAQTEQRNFELARSTQYQAIQDSLGVDKDVMDDLVGITGLSVEAAAQAYGSQVADVKSIRESLGTLGIELLSRQGKMQAQPGININLGGQ